jgi:hypothetical protein
MNVQEQLVLWQGVKVALKDEKVTRANMAFYEFLVVSPKREYWLFQVVYSIKGMLGLIKVLKLFAHKYLQIFNSRI